MHAFMNNGRCFHCNASREQVADRKAPPWCERAPEPDVSPQRSQTSGY